MIHWTPAYVALGSNLDDPIRQISVAFRELAALKDTRMVARSRLYASRPLGPQDQPDFVNAAAGLLTRLEPRELLGALKRIEQSMGRAQPPVRWGPRRIDLDLLLHGSAVIDEPGLKLPHAGLHERNFVLYPLAEIAPALRIPSCGRVADLASRLGNDGLRAIGVSE